MKLSVLALDLDGTIARNDAVDPAARTSIAGARNAGLVTLIVTGRTLPELERVAESLHFVDGVVAENGALLYFPATGRLSVLAPPIPPVFVAELERRQIPHTTGRCLVDADASQAARLLEVIHALELPLALLFNGGRVMTLSQGVSKATGLRRALDTLRLSPRNTLAIGDRENDHELLRFAEVGAAVAWGSRALREAADIVLPGSGPPDVAAYVDGLARSGRLPVPPRARRRIDLGHTDDGAEFSLAVLGRNILVAGDVKSGKSWVTGLLCEQLILHGYCVCVLDPEGDYRTLEALPGVTVLGGEDPPPTPRDLLRALRYPDRSLVIDMSRMPQDEKVQYMRAVLPALNVLRRRTGLPHRIVLDEAHHFLHDADGASLLDLELNGYTIVSYRASQLPAAVLKSAEVILVTCESSRAELDVLRRSCTHCDASQPAAWSLVGHLKVGQTMVLPVTAEAGGRLRLVTLGPRVTPHVRHREKYVDVPVGDAKAFAFGGDRRFRSAGTLRQFVATLAAAAPATLEGYVRRGDFSRWIREVYGDRALADELQAIEQRHKLVPRPETILDIVDAIRARYDLADEPAAPEPVAV